MQVHEMATRARFGCCKSQVVDCVHLAVVSVRAHKLQKGVHDCLHFCLRLADVDDTQGAGQLCKPGIVHNT